ncbi:5'-nucleotidase [Ligilactobacillus salitolerans]|uniref:5'-nucleotidase n=1 Tax=Ligilactobacillus salitolerans TaxID=1808352 RepID=A0A401IT15_9LACO|nr:bifunctional UDP-sugar hydrolase/5'-nucleotidase [Ligilactobacillus salitolerans]GBG94668.1 5'-nucleotidase [Ligilactobacillus salitolerans]
MNEKITILHTNDIHSHFENWPKIRRYLQKTKRRLESQGQTVVTVDLGDAMDRVHPLTEATNGKANIDLLNTVEYDALTIGNNEGIGNSHEELEDLYTNSNAPVILDNFIDLRTDERPSWTQRAKIIQTANNTRVGLLACTAPFGPTYAMNDWQALDIDSVLPDLVQRLRPRVDVLVLMSHLGIDMDRYIARKYPQFDIILGSHTHHLLENGELDGKTLVCAAGKWGQYVGRVDLTLGEDKKISEKIAQTISTLELPEVVGDQNEIESYVKQGQQILRSQKVACLPEDYSSSLVQDYPLMQESLAAVEEATQTKTAILNAGLFLGDLKKGILTKNELHQLLPHPMRMVKVRLTGYNLWRLIREMEKNRRHLRRSIVKGNGFRGTVFGELVYDGISYDQTEKTVLLHGHALDPEKIYTIGTVDNFIYGPFFPTLEIAGEISYIGDRFLRDALGTYFAQKFPV